MRAYFDCRAGISGHMALAALCHLGLVLAPLQKKLFQAGIACQWAQCQECRTAGPGARVDVHWPDGQALRHPMDMAAIIARVDVAEAVRSRALAVLAALTAAEAHVRQIPPEKVHFHGVEAMDTLVNIIGAVWGLAEMGIDSVTASPLPWFSGTVECAHGLLPLPAPATAYLMQGKPVFSTDATSELITPTGAALLHALVDDFADGPTGHLVRMGTGYGSRPASDGLRIWLLEAGKVEQAARREEVLLLESHVDHLTGEEVGAALEALMAVPEVLDVLWLPGTGKKNRPAGLLRVLCLPRHGEAVRTAYFVHTHTLGLRCQRLERWILPREPAVVQGADGPVAAKAYTLQGRQWLRPECDALKEAAAREGLGLPAMRMQKK